MTSPKLNADPSAVVDRLTFNGQIETGTTSYDSPTHVVRTPSGDLALHGPAVSRATRF